MLSAALRQLLDEILFPLRLSSFRRKILLWLWIWFILTCQFTFQIISNYGNFITSSRTHYTLILELQLLPSEWRNTFLSAISWKYNKYREQKLKFWISRYQYLQIYQIYNIDNWFWCFQCFKFQYSIFSCFYLLYIYELADKKVLRHSEGSSCSSRFSV